MNNKFFVSLLIFIVTASLIAIGCTETENKVSEEKKEELESEITDLENEIDDLETRLDEYSELPRELSFAEKAADDYTIFLEKALENLNEEEVKEVAKQGYQHELTIRPTGTTKNREEIPSDGRVKTALDEFSVEISEKQRAIPDIGDSFIKKAEENKLEHSENYPSEQELLVVKTEGVDYKHGVSSSPIDRGHSFWLTFEEIEKGKTLEIEVDSQIKERVGLKTDVLEIEVEE
ncbi:hypothetical protein [Natranaerobius thermophilus]|uniref:hypothetical protein n=1 Tax=Natranaerobius thermophilus TaxID=375929 RepID=UPI0011D179BE|nr:hypothetical protein [Natranaerobius thermophilus]